MRPLPLTFTIGLLSLILASIGYWLYNARHGDSDEWKELPTKVMEEPVTAPDVWPDSPKL